MPHCLRCRRGSDCVPSARRCTAAAANSGLGSRRCRFPPEQTRRPSESRGVAAPLTRAPPRVAERLPAQRAQSTRRRAATGGPTCVTTCRSASGGALAERPGPARVARAGSSRRCLSKAARAKCGGEARRLWRAADRRRRATCGRRAWWDSRTEKKLFRIDFWRPRAHGFAATLRARRSTAIGPDAGPGAPPPCW